MMGERSQDEFYAAQTPPLGCRVEVHPDPSVHTDPELVRRHLGIRYIGRLVATDGPRICIETPDGTPAWFHLDHVRVEDLTDEVPEEESL